MLARMSIHRVAALVLTIACSLPHAMQAQEPFRFKLQKGEKIVYNVEQESTVLMQNGKEKSSVASSTKFRQAWNVTKAEPTGEVEMELTLERIVVEETDPTGKQLKFDSDAPNGAHPALKEQLGALIGKPAVRVRMTTAGDVKSFENLTNQKSMSRELPFLISVSGQPVKVGLTWDRAVDLSLTDAQGKAANFAAIQTCKVEAVDAKEIIVAVDTKLKDTNLKVEDRSALAPFQPKGQIKLDPALGRLTSASLQVDQKFQDLDGPDSSYHYTSKFTAKLIEPDKSNP